jgi:hypothetical protein
MRLLSPSVRRRFARRLRAAALAPPMPPVTIRHAFPDDGLELMRLAALDGAESLVQPVLVAEVDGELRAALSLGNGAVVADPFHRTAALVELLLARAAQLAAADARAASQQGWQSRQVLRARFRENA